MNISTQNDPATMAERWIRREVPFINRSTEAHGDVRFLINAIRLRMEAFALAARSTRDPEAAMKLLQLLGMAVSSVERHLQAVGAEPGEGVTLLRAGPVLMQLADVAGHVPRDSHDTYWLRNRGDRPLTFTGASDESMLIRLMNEMQRLQTASAELLRPLCTGEVPVTWRTSIDAMDLAARHHDQLTVLLHDLLAPAAAKRRGAMEFDMFARMLSSYLVDYPVGTQMYAAPDPANMPSMMEMILLVGPSGAHRDEVKQRMPMLLREDRMRLEQAMSQPSLTMRVARAAGLTEDDLRTLTPQQLADRLEAQPWLDPVVEAFGRLADAVDTSSSYFSKIGDYLHGAATAMPSPLDEMKTMVQRYDTLPQFPRLRQSHPVVRRLLAAVQA